MEYVIGAMTYKKRCAKRGSATPSRVIRAHNTRTNRQKKKMTWIYGQIKQIMQENIMNRQLKSSVLYLSAEMFLHCGITLKGHKQNNITSLENFHVGLSSGQTRMWVNSHESFFQLSSPRAKRMWESSLTLKKKLTRFKFDQSDESRW